jgi:hypothetical protein
VKNISNTKSEVFAQGYQSDRKEFNRKALQTNLEITEKSWPFLKKKSLP